MHTKSSPVETFKGRGIDFAAAFLGRYSFHPVCPRIGGVLATGLLGGLLAHTGIYMGKGEVVELDGEGRVRRVDLETFQSASIFRTGPGIFTACDGLIPIGDPLAAERACMCLGDQHRYDLVFDNCHRFTSGCITGDFENADTLFFLLMRTLSRHYSLRHRLTFALLKHINR